MRRRDALRRVRLVHAAVGATVIAIPAAAAALAEADTPNATAAQPGGAGVTMNVHSRRIPLGRNVVVTGAAPAAEAGQTVTLDFATAGTRSWHALSSARVTSTGGFRLAAALHRSGAVRVTASWQQQPVGSPPAAVAADQAAGDSTTAQLVTVAARLRADQRALQALGSGRLEVDGRLAPGTRGRRVRLEALRSGRWQTIAASRTGNRGRFHLRFLASGSGRERLRVVFAGDRLNGAARDAAGSVSFLTPSVASWYSDGGSTACGFHAYYGVANRSLPCGTKVTFSYGGRSVTAVVDDRGPFVAGRDWDLNQNTAAALGFGGVGTVWTSH